MWIYGYRCARRRLFLVWSRLIVAFTQYLPFLGILPVFFVAGLPLASTIVHWFSACVCIGIYTLGHAYFKSLQFNKRRPWAPPRTAAKGGRGKQTKKSSKAPPPPPSAADVAAAADPAHKIGAAFQTSHNFVLLAITSIPLAVTVYVATFEPRGGAVDRRHSRALPLRWSHLQRRTRNHRVPGTRAVEGKWAVDPLHRVDRYVYLWG